MAKDNSQDDQHWENRTLCSDENCIGVIGPDGRCRECGKKFEGDPSGATLTSEESVQPADMGPEETELEETADAFEEPAEPQPSDLLPESDWESRTLCSDESCIGVIGPDGRCKECGKPFQP